MADPLLSFITKDTLGLEIGASHAPRVRRADGYDVRKLDHLSREDLIKKYEGRGAVKSIDAIEHVDYVWSGEPYLELVGEETKFDWIVASHVIEHTPDLVGFLNNCESILTPGGKLCLAVPDKRFCFDRFRPLTSIGSLIDAHHEGRIRPSAGAIADSKLNAVNRDGRLSWPRENSGAYTEIHDAGYATRQINLIREGQYIDTHVWVFTPASFQLHIRDLRDLGYTSLYVETLRDASAFEFLSILSRSEPTEPQPSRLDMLKRIDDEQRFAERF